MIESSRLESSELDTAERILALAGRAGVDVDVEASVDRVQLSLTRFAGSAIHQNVADDTVTVRLRVHADGRTASGSSTIVSADGLEDLAGRILHAARHAPLDSGWPGLAPAAVPPPTPRVDEATASASPADRAARVRDFVDAAGGLETAGACRTVAWQGAFVNSAGQSSVGRSAVADVDGIARDAGNDGVARYASSRFVDIDGAVLGARAAAKARAGADPVELPPGRYDVVLEPTAVADLLQNLALYGFNGKAVTERQSFVEVGTGQFDAAVTLVDDAPAVGRTHDAEGTPHRRLVLVDRGTTSAVTHDRRTAAEAGVESTGHGIGMASWGALATHLSLSPGSGQAPVEVEGPAADSSVATLVAGVERGLLVTDLWYTRVLDPKSLAVTGLTRNGVWLIEAGEVTRPVRNFRFTQSYAAALAPGNVVAVGDSAMALPDSWASARWTAPALRLASWNFTGGASG